jgi:hypothetical protein
VSRVIGTASLNLDQAHGHCFVAGRNDLA